MNALRVFAFCTVVAVSLSAPAAAQGAPRTTGAPVASQMAVGVRRIVNAPFPLGQPAPFRQDTKQNRALMIVGGAAMLTGAVIGHDAGPLISVGGAVVFLWGLYQYLQ